MADKRDFQEYLDAAGTVDRILTCIEFSKALVSAYDMETLLTTRDLLSNNKANKA